MLLGKTIIETWHGFDISKVSRYSLDELLSRIRAEKREIMIYGAGVQARYAISALMSKGREVKYICDSSPHKLGEPFCGLNISSLEGALADSNGAPCVFIGSCFPTQILAQLAKYNIRDIFSCMPLFDGTNFAEIPINNEGLLEAKKLGDIEREISLYNVEFKKFESKLKPTELKLKSLDLNLTEKCTLKCIDCSNLMQYYKAPKHTEIDTLLESIDKIMKTVDWVFEFRVLGGEPFVYKDMHKVLNRLLQYANFDNIIVYTNGTIVPKKDNLDCLRDRRVVVDISNYGNLSINHDKLVAVLEEANISYATKRPVWTDSGRILPFQNRSHLKDKELFFNCCTNDVLTILHGKLYHCPYSAAAESLKAIPDDPDDSIDLSKENVGRSFREKLDYFYKKKNCLTACAYCAGRDYSTPNIETAAQTKIPLPIPQKF
jgi:organic radical activating enzyme